MEYPRRPEAYGCRIVTERNRYFTGKPMTARDFTGEQDYFLSHHRLHNRLLHGWGIVCGLDVMPHPNPDCRSRWVIVKAGIAIDCCGRELVLAEDIAFRIAGPEPLDWEPPPEGLLLYVQYEEELIECLPVLYHEGGCDPTRTEPNRVREGAHLAVTPFDEVEDGCWKVNAAGTPGRYDCDEDLPEPEGSCLEPHCPCGQKVPLARLIFQKNDVFTIDVSGVTRLNTPRDTLTHITAINWTHGGELELGDLRQRGRTLKVWFNRPLLPSEHDGTGINPYTFVVQYGNIQRDLEFLTAECPPTLEEDGCVAVFTIDEDYFRPRNNIAGSTVFVTLKCDFLLDCHHKPVDGDHLQGVLPSGNGVPGGVFESWFQVVPDGGKE